MSSQDVIEKIRADMEKGLEGLSGAYEEEHKRQLAMMEEMMNSRKVKHSEAKEQKKLEMLRKAEQDNIAKLHEYDKIREARKNKDQLLQTISSGQKLIMKGCYSRPLYNFNKKQHANAIKNNDIAFLLNNQSTELKEQVMSRLLKKVSDLEEKVTTDVTKPQPKKASMIERLAARAQERAAGDRSDVTSQKSSDTKVSNAKAILGQLFKKKQF